MTEEVKAYLGKMYGNELYKELDIEQQESIIFTAQELLQDVAGRDKITARMAALQVLYMLESKDSDFSSLKSQGVKSYSVKGVSISFGDTEGYSGSNGAGLIAPIVMQLLRPNGGAKVGRLI